MLLTMELLYTQTLLNSEIDIEIGGACPDYSQNYGYNVARLNGWGGQWGCSGNCTNNFTMHTQMPASLKSPQGVNVDDGYYHKLSIVYHSGTDFTPNALDPNGTYPDTREPGFIKWFVDDVEWGGGWTGNTYGFDYVPITATRLVFGPEATDWAGCCLCATTSGLCNGCADNQALQGRCYALCGTPSDITNPVEPSECVYGTCVPSTAVSTSANAAAYEAFGEAFSGSGYAPPCNEWSTATLNIAKIQFTPTCLDCTLPTNPAYISDATLPARPDATKGKLLGPSNRNRCLPETKPYQVFPVT
jgi:hypothetical protein